MIHYLLYWVDHEEQLTVLDCDSDELREFVEDIWDRIENLPKRKGLYCAAIRESDYKGIADDYEVQSVRILLVETGPEVEA